jgi:acetyl-CoA carboxylase biotin carboxyl carrier protein
MATIDINCDITGTIWKILVSEGQTVTEDEPVVIVESMKMEIPVMAPEDGTITEIVVAEGDMVAEGALLARMST